jgi:hypothetical protein
MCPPLVPWADILWADTLVRIPRTLAFNPRLIVADEPVFASFQ